MKRKLVLVLLPHDVVENLDRIRETQGRSRSAVVRDAVTRYVAEASDDAKDRMMAQAYRRIPDGNEFDAWSNASVQELVNEETW